MSTRDDPQAVDALLSGQSGWMWIARATGSPAGCVVLRPLTLEEPALECKRLYVRSQHRGRRIASALMDVLEQFARELGASWVYLDTKDDLGPAIALYTARGYERCERYNDNSQATIFFRKNLKPAAAAKG